MHGTDAKRRAPEKKAREMNDRIHGHQIDLLPYLGFELREAGRADLADQIDEIHRSYRDTGVLDVAVLDEIVHHSLELNLSTALMMAKDQRIEQVIESTPALREFSGSRTWIESLIADRVRVLQAEQIFDAWAVSEAQAEYDETAAELITLVKPAKLRFDVVFAAFTELIEAELRVRLRGLADDMESENYVELDTRLDELPDELSNEFDDEIREPLAKAFEKQHGVNPGELYGIDSTELSEEHDALLNDWEQTFCGAAREFLLHAYSEA